MRKATERKNENLVLGGSTKFFDDIFEEHLKQRKIILNDEIDCNIVETIMLQILKWNELDKGLPTDKRKPIKILISSPGGDVMFGLPLIDIIKNSKTPVYGIILSYGYSMAAGIFISCHQRYMLPSSSILLHDGSSSLSGSANKVKDLQKFYNKIDDILKDIIVSKTKITSEEFDANADRELYMMPEECFDKGICDYIIGINCELDDIL